MEINRNAPATARGELQIAADPQTVFAVLPAIGQWPSWNPDIKSVDGRARLDRALELSLLKGYSRKSLDKAIRSVLSHLKVEAERRAAT